MLGVKLPFPKESDGLHARFEAYDDNGYQPVKEYQGLTACFDGMNGRYIFVGKVLARSEINENLDGPLDLEEYTGPSTKWFRESIAALISLQFGIQNPEVKLWFFTHYH
jgi:hypothetical protein